MVKYRGILKLAITKAKTSNFKPPPRSLNSYQSIPFTFTSKIKVSQRWLTQLPGKGSYSMLPALANVICKSNIHTESCRFMSKNTCMAFFSNAIEMCMKSSFCKIIQRHLVKLSKDSDHSELTSRKYSNIKRYLYFHSSALRAHKSSSDI